MEREPVPDKRNSGRKENRPAAIDRFAHALLIVTGVLFLLGSLTATYMIQDIRKEQSAGRTADAETSDLNHSIAAEANADAVVIHDAPATESETQAITQQPTETAATETETETEKVTETERVTETEKVTETERVTETEKVTETERVTETEKVTETERVTETEKVTERQTETAAPPETEPAPETEYDPTEGGIHKYSLIQSDASWEDNFEAAKASGGYMLRINSQEEYDFIVASLELTDTQDVCVIQIGARRDPNSKLYYWADEDNNLYGDPINALNVWSTDEWMVTDQMVKEPSFEDGSGEKTISEDKLALYKYKDKWWLNDITNDIVEWFPPDKGKVAYMIEYEN